MGYTHTHLSLVHTHHFALCQRGTHILILGTAPRQWHLAGGFYMRHFQWLEWSQKKFMGETKDAWPHLSSITSTFLCIKGGSFCENEGKTFWSTYSHFSADTFIFHSNAKMTLVGFAWIVLLLMIFTQGDEDLSFSLFSYLMGGDCRNTGKPCGFWVLTTSSKTSKNEDSYFFNCILAWLKLYLWERLVNSFSFLSLL